MITFLPAELIDYVFSFLDNESIYYLKQAYRIPDPKANSIQRRSHDAEVIYFDYGDSKQLYYNIIACEFNKQAIWHNRHWTGSLLFYGSKRIIIEPDVLRDWEPYHDDHLWDILKSQCKRYLRTRHRKRIRVI